MFYLIRLFRAYSAPLLHGWYGTQNNRPSKDFRNLSEFVYDIIMYTIPYVYLKKCKNILIFLKFFKKIKI